MSDTTDKPKLGTRAPLGLKRTVETGKVKQSFSHGRSNTVVVEVKRRRVLGPQGAPQEEQTPAPEPVAAAPAPQAPAPAAPTPPAGTYFLDKAHTSVTFRVSHLGFSHYTARFGTVDGRLTFDPAHPANMKVEATIAVPSLELNTPPVGFHDQLMSKAWFDAARFPTMTFRST